MALFRAFLSAGVLLAGLLQPVAASEIRIVATDAVRRPVMAIVDAYRKETGNQALAMFGPPSGIAARIASDKQADILLWSLSDLNALAQSGEIAPDYPKVVGRVRIALAVRAGAPRPDIRTPEKVRDYLLRVPSFALGDPRSKSRTDVHLVKMMSELGIPGIIKEKGVLSDGGMSVLKEVADGRVTAGFAQASEIAAMPGVRFAGFLPDSLQLTTVHAAAMTLKGKESEAATALFREMTRSESSDIFEKSGFEVRR